MSEDAQVIPISTAAQKAEEERKERVRQVIAEIRAQLRKPVKR